MKALSLRFGVLLTPAFWSTPIKRDLMIGDAGAQLGESEHQREAEAVQRAEAAVECGRRERGLSRRRGSAIVDL